VTVHKHWAAFWLALIPGLGLLDWVLDKRHDGSTLSECSRWVFHTDSTPGKVAFTISLWPGAYVLWRHIVRPVYQAAADEIEEMRAP
jgi:hypothetical protein